MRVATEDIVATYLSGDVAGAWGKFLAQANITLTEEDMAQWSGEPDPQAAADELFFFAHTLRSSTWWHPDIAKLRAGKARIVIGLGDTSAGQMCDRTSNALATQLGLTPVPFVGGHIGFVEQPDKFATQLRSALD